MNDTRCFFPALLFDFGTQQIALNGQGLMDRHEAFRMMSSLFKPIVHNNIADCCLDCFTVARIALDVA